MKGAVQVHSRLLSPRGTQSQFRARELDSPVQLQEGPPDDRRARLAKLVLCAAHIAAGQPRLGADQGLGHGEKGVICRICFRELADEGLIPGVKKASW